MRHFKLSYAPLSQCIWSGSPSEQTWPTSCCGCCFAIGVQLVCFSKLTRRERLRGHETLVRLELGSKHFLKHFSRSYPLNAFFEKDSKLKKLLSDIHILEIFNVKKAALGDAHFESVLNSMNCLHKVLHLKKSKF